MTKLMLPRAGLLRLKRDLLPCAYMWEAGTSPRPNLEGIGVARAKDGTAVLLATDGHRLRVIPDALLGAERHDGPTIGLIPSAKVRAHGPPQTIHTLRFEADKTLPAFEQVIPRRQDHTFHVDREAFRKAVENAVWVSSSWAQKAHAAWKKDRDDDKAFLKRAQAGLDETWREAKARHANAKKDALAEWARAKDAAKATKTKAPAKPRLPPAPTRVKAKAARSPTPEPPRTSHDVLLIINPNGVFLYGYDQGETKGDLLPREIAWYVEGSARERVEDRRVKVNGAYLIEALASFPDQGLEIAFSGALDPITLRPLAIDRSPYDVAVIMPVR